MAERSTERELIRYLGQIGPARAVDLCEHLQISQPVFSRMVRGLGGEQLLVVGSARSTRYLARRLVDGVGATAPIYAVGDGGETQRVATLHAVQPRGFWVEPEVTGFEARLHADLPFFLHDQRPAGYLGRLIPKRHPDLDLPTDVTLWSGDGCLKYFARYGWDLPGNLIVGDGALEKYLADAGSGGRVLAKAERPKEYLRASEDLLAYGPAGSSAAGEQPKLLARREPGRTNVLVKFSPPLATAVGRRWADLLICEHVAHAVLAAHGFAAPRSELIETDERLFLEIERFDRTPTGGRRAVVSCMALDLEYVGSAMSSWPVTARALHQQGRLDARALREVARLELFGRLIANTDMHLANLSFFADTESDTGAGSGFVGPVAPVYDMLPMAFAPEHGQVVPLELPKPKPKPDDGPIWNDGCEMARSFWQSVAAQARVSAPFAAFTSECAAQVGAWGKLAKLMPR